MSDLGQAMASMLRIRQETGGAAEPAEPGVSTVSVECGSGNEYDGRMGVRISSIFVILVGSLLGALLPVFLARSSHMHLPQKAFFVAKYFGTGVIIATAFMHLLVPAFEALASPCLQGLQISEYAWAGGITFITVIVMFTVELIVAHFDIFNSHDEPGVASNPSVETFKKSDPLTTAGAGNGNGAQQHDVESGRRKTQQSHGLSYPPGGDNHLGHRRSHTENDAFAAQMTALFILEFGVIFHSIFIGLTLAVAGDEFTVLYVVLVFHQTFEGLGLGSRLATAQWPKGKGHLPYLLAVAYAVTTPIAIAIGLGVRQTLTPEATTNLIVNGVFDAISAGILIYTGLVELLAHEFMFSPHMRHAGLRNKLEALACVYLGGGLMALLAKWA